MKTLKTKLNRLLDWASVKMHLAVEQLWVITLLNIGMVWAGESIVVALGIGSQFALFPFALFVALEVYLLNRYMQSCKR